MLLPKLKPMIPIEFLGCYYASTVLCINLSLIRWVPINFRNLEVKSIEFVSNYLENKSMLLFVLLIHS